jgi:tetratricopeptide (TPR) repeat protein
MNVDEISKKIKEADELRDHHGKVKDSIEILEELGEEIKDDPLLSYDYPRILKKLAICYSDLGQVEKAYEYLNQALEVAKQDLNKIQIADIRTCLASLELKVGSAEKALECALKAWEYIGKKRGDKFTKTKVHTAIVLGNIYFELARYNKALKKYKAALRYAEVVAYTKGKIKALGKMANYYIVMEKDFNRAQEILEENIEEAEQFCKMVLPRLEMSLSRIYLERGDIDSAKELATKAYKFAKKGGFLRLTAQSSELLGQIHAKKSQARADSYFKIAFDSYNKGGYNMPTEHPKVKDWYTSFDDV